MALFNPRAHATEEPAMTGPGEDVDSRARALIPGAFEKRPATARQPGSMSDPPSGVLDPHTAPLPMSEATRADRRREGGGGGGQRRPGRRHTR
jgi:hypothetical protein